MKTRIKEIRKAAHMTQDQLAEAVGVSRGAVSLWESMTATELPTVDNLGKIAAACGVSVGSIFAESSNGFVEFIDQNKSVPVLEWHIAALHLIPMSEYIDKDVVRIPCPIAHSDKAYALAVEGQSMTSSNPLSKTYPEGCIIYCDPEKAGNVQSGTPVIAYIESTDEAVFKIYIKDGGREWLESLNQSYSHITDAFTIRAIVIGAFHAS